MKKTKIYIVALAMTLFSCEGLVDGINDNPNGITIEDVDGTLFLTGPMLANTVVQAGHLNRIAAMYSGQLVGFQSLYGNIYGYNVSAEESNSTWSHIYVGIIPNVRYVREAIPNDKLVVGITKVLEAHAIGTAAAIFGDVPYSQINNNEIEDPVFDSQVDVLNDVIALLDDAIVDLNTATTRSLSVDIYYNGNKTKWIEAANTLKARYYMLLKDYPSALAAAGSGISTAANNMRFVPRGDASIAEGDKNLYNTLLSGSRAGDIGTGNSYLMQLLNPANGSSRNNAKTDETARFKYYTIVETSSSQNFGIAAQFEPMNLVTFQENKLIQAECAARANQFATSLTYLNEVRAYLNTGGFLNAFYSGESKMYSAYVAADFDNAGLENPDNLTPIRALLREIIEERYVSCFGTYIPFDDARRLRKSDLDISVDIPFNVPSATQHPERLPYSDDEINSNPNAVEPGIYVKTEVNQ